MKTLESINFSRLLRSVWLWPVILIISTVATAVMFYTNSPSVLRPWLVLWFLLVCPGKAMVRIFEVQESLLEWVLSIALSISLAGIISTIQIYTHTWSPAINLGILIGLTLGGVIVQSMLNFRIISWPFSQASIPLGKEMHK
jgi:uncharacterized membrane protein YadS